MASGATARSAFSFRIFCLRWRPWAPNGARRFDQMRSRARAKNGHGRGGMPSAFGPQHLGASEVPLIAT